MPAAVFVQSGETRQPDVITIVHPCIRFGQITVNAECRHGEDTECHLPHVVVGDVVFQPVIEVLVHIVPFLLDGFKQLLPLRGSQLVVERVVRHGAE